VDISEFKDSIKKQFKPVQRKVLIAIANGCSVSDACTAAGKQDCTHYHWIKNVEGYKAAVELANDISINRFEAELEICALRAKTDAKYTRSLEFLLKARRRDRYGDVQRVETVNKQPLIIELTQSAGESEHEQGQESSSEVVPPANPDSEIK